MMPPGNAGWCPSARPQAASSAPAGGGSCVKSTQCGLPTACLLYTSCELLRLYLVKEGYNVTMVHDGGAALAEFDKLHPDLVLLDVMMPVMDGWEVCRKLRAKDNTPIIMLTAKGETYDKVLGLELGADDYIVKPFDAKEVTALSLIHI